MSLSEFLLCAALATAGVALFQWPSVVLRKIGMLLIISSTGLLAYFWTLSPWIGMLGALGWILLPVSEVVFVLRTLRLPRDRGFQDAIAPIEDFPELRDMSLEVEALGFQRADDCRLLPSFCDQFYRLFTHPEKPVHAAIGCLSQNHVGILFIAYISEESNGSLWVTWNYPLTYGLKMPPGIALHRVPDAETPEDLLNEHIAFLEANQKSGPSLILSEITSSARDRLHRALSLQFDYNVRIGFLMPDATSQSSFRYSWRGILYVTRQVVADLVRLS